MSSREADLASLRRKQSDRRRQERNREKLRELADAREAELAELRARIAASGFAGRSGVSVM